MNDSLETLKLVKRPDAAMSVEAGLGGPGTAHLEPNQKAS